jgi:hypothetical protein
MCKIDWFYVFSSSYNVFDLLNLYEGLLFLGDNFIPFLNYYEYFCMLLKSKAYEKLLSDRFFYAFYWFTLGDTSL